MSTKELIKKAILNVGEKKKRFQAPSITDALQEPVSRQYVTSILKDLVQSGDLLRTGGGRYTFYALPKYAEYLGKRIRQHFLNNDLEEHEVLDSLEKQAAFIADLPENMKSIFTYSFSEMMNNAIEHSQSKNISVEISTLDQNLNFVVQDEGIGAFRNVMNKRKLASELEAIQDLLKGKTTTAAHAHSGEGIFFTSKIADVFVLDSFGYRLRVDNLINDVFLEELKVPVKGTRVEFSLAVDSKKHLNDIFTHYQTDPSEYAFDRTEILVKLYTMGSIYISRSQARRVMSSLGGKFRVITLDFDKVPTVGQAFADEIFRVFKKKYPYIEVTPTNMNKAVSFMVNRVAEE